MFAEDFLTMCNAAKSKVAFLKNNPLGYFIASMLAGIFVGFGILLVFSIRGMMSGIPYAKVVMGISFGVALSLVVIAGAELFTGNNMVMMGGILNKTITFMDAIKLWIVCWLGNFIGSILIALLFYWAGLATGNVGEFIASTAQAKMEVDFLPLLVRGILCNILVCLAVWCSFRCKSESGKLIMIFWCLFVFITAGFEHSIANMTLLSISLLSPMSATVTITGFFYNLIVVTLGNMIGGIVFVALPYYMISKKKEG